MYGRVSKSLNDHFIIADEERHVFAYRCSCRRNSIAIVSWCRSKIEDIEATDIYELETEADFSECKNFPKLPIMSDSDNPLPNGFLVKIGSKPRYFANLIHCSKGLKIKIT